MMHSKIRIAVLGSTGSIGQQVLDIIRTFPERFTVIALAGGKNFRLLSAQMAEFHPSLIHFQPEASLSNKSNLHDSCRWLPLEEIAAHPDADMIVLATSGMTGLLPALAAARAGKRIALANKEALIIAGGLITSEARRHKAQILPVNSEHSAIWQCLRGERKDKISRIILTASGGPFYHYSYDKLAHVTVAAALQHPTWKMGKKITIDSATLMNKGMEVLEAHWLFQTPLEKIQVIIHPQSIVHSMVEFTDGSIKAQLSQPDMRIPIQHALFYPERLNNPELPLINWDKLSQLTFAKVDTQKFPCLDLAREAGRKGGTYPAALSAADEIAVELFLSGKINFPDIAKIIEYVLHYHSSTGSSLAEIIAADKEARKYAREWKQG